MKKILPVIILTCLAAAGCEREVIVDVEPAFRHMLHATAENNGTKADVSDAGIFTWTAGDAISVYKEGSLSTYTATSSESASDFTLSTGSAIDAPSVAVYPAAIANETWAFDMPDAVMLRLPSSYTIEEGATAGTAGMPMLAKGNGTNNLSFKHLGGMLKLNLSTVPTSVVKFVASFPGARVNGDYCCFTDEETPMLYVEEGYSPVETSITFTYASSRTAADDNVILYIPLPAGDYKGVTVDMLDASDQVIARFSRGAFKIQRKKLFYISAANKTFGLGDNVQDAASFLSGSTITLPNTDESIALDFSNIENNAGTLTFEYGGANRPKTVYIISPDAQNKDQVTLAGNLPSSTVRIIQGTFAASQMVTAESTIIVDEDATVANITILGGNAQVSGKVDNIVVPEGATADGASKPVFVTINKTATATDGSSPVTLTANTRIKLLADVQVTLVVNNGAPIEYSDLQNYEMFSSEWDGVSSEAPIQIDEDHFDICNAAQLAGFRDAVNAGNTYAGKTVSMRTGVKLNEHPWVPIGLSGADANSDENAEENVFLGTFEGNGCIISGLIINRTGARSFAGLFGTIQCMNEHHVSIRNVWIANLQVRSQHHAAGLLGRYYGKHANSSLTIEGCCVEYGSIYSTAWSDGGVYRNGNMVGGIVGEAYGPGIAINGCGNNNIQFRGTRDVGGIAGRLQTPLSFLNNELNDCIITQTDQDNLETGVDMNTVEAFVGRRDGDWEVDGSNYSDTMVLTLDSAWDGSSTEALTVVDENTYEISTAAQLAQLAAEVNSGISYAGKTVRLAADINLNDKAWTPIGSGEHPFLGTFDGCFHYVFNLNVAATGANSVAGFFGELIVAGSNTVTIRRVILVQATISGNHQAGSILARYQGVNADAHLVIDTCYSIYTFVTSTPWDDGGTARDGNGVGGIIGEATGYGITVRSCETYNSVYTGVRELGGIAGYMSEPEEFSGNRINDCFITQQYPLSIEGGKNMSTIDELVGNADGWVVDTYSNMAAYNTITPQEP